MSDPVTRLNEALEGRYHVERELGEGGMATVYLADDLRHGRKVALKVLKPELAELVGAERFLGEIRTTANLHHPHVVPLHDSGDADGLLFYVMPFIEGESLRDLLRRESPLDVGEAVRIAASLADALDHAHRHGVVHRDVKPGNVLLVDGEPLLADFGIAFTQSDREHASRLTKTGSSIGTPGYMSPEQAAGERVLGPASDIYSLGALAFEMLTGSAPFAEESPVALLARVLTEDPPDASVANPAVPSRVAGVVSRALARAPEDRHASAAALARDLRAAAAPTPSDRGVRKPVARRWATLSAALVVVAVGVGVLVVERSREERWARVEALPEIRRLVGAGEQAAAFALARRAVAILPDDPALVELYETVSEEVTFASDPPGALVSYRPYDPADTSWTTVGAAPVAALLPEEELLVRFEAEGYRPYTVSFTPRWGDLRATLTPDDAGEVVHVEGGPFSMTGEPILLGAFRIDEHEVTNAEYQEFVATVRDRDSRYWVDPFAAHGVDVDVDRMEAELVDRTGRPGPAGWELGRHPDGAERYPVQGVSWFEAVAYCAFRGRSLPTYYHWKFADAGEVSPWDGVLQHAALGRGDGPVPVGASEAVSTRGVADMAGNVREWVWNAAGEDRYILGGSWVSPPHLYTDFDAADPWSRIEENGFRCVSYDGDIAPELTDPIELPVFDFTDFEPVDDATFDLYAAFYQYDRVALNAERVLVSETPDWTKEVVEFDAAYLDERVTVHLFLPKEAEPPYQSVVYFPGVSAFSLSSSRNIAEMAQLMFVPESGRALLYPVVSGTYERIHDRPTRGMAERRQRYVWMTQDIMRTVDFIEEAEDLDAGAVAYMGMSFGAELALPIALEKRFRTTVLIGGALDPGWIDGQPEEAAPWNFISRVTTPTILINGRYDFMHPYEEAQLPFFEMIDVPPEDKEFVVLPTGHLPPNTQVVSHTLRWLDERLGPVAFAPGR